MNIRGLLLIVPFILIGCSGSTFKGIDGYYYKVNSKEICHSYNVVAQGQIECFTEDGKKNLLHWYDRRRVPS